MTTWIVLLMRDPKYGTRMVTVEGETRDDAEREALKRASRLEFVHKIIEQEEA